MRAAHQPEAFGIVLEPEEMDLMVEVWRMFVRDNEATVQHAEMLAQLEEAYASSGRERAGGRSIDMRYLLDAGEPVVPEDEDDDGGAAVEEV